MGNTARLPIAARNTETKGHHNSSKWFKVPLGSQYQLVKILLSSQWQLQWDTHIYNKPEIPGQTVCYKQEFVIS